MDKNGRRCDPTPESGAFLAASPNARWLIIPRVVMTPLSRVSFSARRFMAARLDGLLRGEMTDDVLVGRFQQPGGRARD